MPYLQNAYNSLAGSFVESLLGCPSDDYHRQLALYTASLAVHQTTSSPEDAFDIGFSETLWATAGPSSPTFPPFGASPSSALASDIATTLHSDNFDRKVIPAGRGCPSPQSIPFIPYPSLAYGYQHNVPSASSYPTSTSSNPHFGYSVPNLSAGTAEDADQPYSLPHHRSSYPLAQSQYSSSLYSDRDMDNYGVVSCSGSTSSEMDFGYFPTTPHRSCQSLDSAASGSPLAPAAAVDESASRLDTFASCSSFTDDQMFFPFNSPTQSLEEHRLPSSLAAAPSSLHCATSSTAFMPATPPPDLDVKRRRLSIFPALPGSTTAILFPAQKGRKRRTLANADEISAEWAGVEDGQERRKVQNKLAQRAFRARNRKREEEVAAAEGRAVRSVR